MSDAHLPKVKEFKNPDGLPKALLEEIVKPGCGLVGDKPEPIMADVLRYLVDGELSSVLLSLGGKEIASSLALHRVEASSSTLPARERMRKNRRALFSQIPASATGFFERLGEFFEAASQSSKIKFQRRSGWPAWLLSLLWEIVDSSCSYDSFVYDYYYGDHVRVIDVKTLCAIFRAANLSEETIIEYFIPEAKFLATSQPIRSDQFHPYRAFREWKPFLSHHSDLVAKALSHTTGKEALSIVELLTHSHFDFEKILPTLAGAATSAAKTLREACFPHVLKHSQAIQPELTRLARHGDSGQRSEAVLLLSKLDAPGMQPLLEELLTGEKSDRVKQTIEKALSALRSQTEAVTEESDILPPLSIELGVQPLPERIRQELRTFSTQCYEIAKKKREEAQAVKKAGGLEAQWVHIPHEVEPLTEQRLQELFSFVEGTAKHFKLIQKEQYFSDWRANIFGDWFNPPDGKLIHVVRLLLALGYISPQGNSFHWPNTQPVDNYRSLCQPPFGLRTRCLLRYSSWNTCKCGMRGVSL